MTNAITVEGVSKRFRIYKNRNQSLKGAFLQRSRAQFEEFWALDDVSFEIPQGKTFGLLGHNGSGKSTLLKCIAKILTPDRGTDLLNGTHGRHARGRLRLTPSCRAARTSTSTARSWA